MGSGLAGFASVWFKYYNSLKDWALRWIYVILRNPQIF